MVTHDQRKFNNNVIRMKQETFLHFVEKSAKELNLGFVPEVKFWKDYCPGMIGNEIAHIHEDTLTICISNIILKNLSDEEIRHTASHEVTHVVNITHDPDFHKTHKIVDGKIWSPRSGGIVTIDSNSDEDKVYSAHELRKLALKKYKKKTKKK